MRVVEEKFHAKQLISSHKLKYQSRHLDVSSLSTY